MTVEELFRALTAFDPDDTVYFVDIVGELHLTTSVGLADRGVIVMGFPDRDSAHLRLP